MLKLVSKAFFCFFFSFCFNAYSGSCCGGGASTVNFITGDAHSVLRTIYSNRTILADVNENFDTVNREDDELESIETLMLSANLKVTQRLQLGVTLPIITKSREINNDFKKNTGVGDIALNLAYEAYPEYTRKQFITQIFVFGSLTFPTAPSLFDSQRADLLDTRGQGHYLVNVGSFFKKVISSNELILNTALTYRLGLSFEASEYSSEVSTKSSLDSKVSITHIYNFSNLFSSLLSLERSFIHTQAVSVFSSKEQSLTLNQLTIGVNLSFDSFDIGISYIDDLLLGQNQGTVLGKTGTVSFIKRL